MNWQKSTCGAFWYAGDYMICAYGRPRRYDVHHENWVIAMGLSSIHAAKRAATQYATANAARLAANIRGKP